MFVTNSLSGGGAERAMNLASNELKRRGWNVALVPINKSVPDFIEPISEVFPLNREWRGGLFGTVLAYFRFNSLVRSWKPDVIILTCDLPEFFGACLLSARSLVLVEEASFPWGTRVFFGKIIRKVLAIRGAKTVGASSHLRIWPHMLSPDVVIQNAITPYKSYQGIAQIKNHLVNINFVGRLSPEKRPNWFIDICDLGGFKGRVVGEGEMKESLANFVRSRNLDVTLLGFLKDPWIKFGTGDLLIVPSVFEGDGLVVIEAMKNGLPILLSDIPDFRRFALPEKHYCVDVAAFVSRINQYENNLEELIVSADITASILLPRSANTVGKCWEEFLDSLKS